MLYRHQRRAANAIGIAIGLLAITLLILSNVPSTEAVPRMGAALKVDAWLGSGIRPEPLRPKTFIRNADLTAGGSPANGMLVLHSESGTTRTVSLGLDASSAATVATQTFARSVTVSFGHNGSLGSTTVAQLATEPAGTFTIAAGETIQIPVSVSIPLTAGDVVAGQEIHLTLVPEWHR